MTNTTNKQPYIGVLALQGDFDAHIQAIQAAGGTAVPIRTAEEVARVEGLILPGGESTTIGKLMARYGLDDAICGAHASGTPIYGTCAGMILLGKGIVSGAERGGQPTLGLMDIRVARNAFGRQVDSFEADIDAPTVVGAENPKLRGVFIRAPYVAETGPLVEVLAHYDDRIVLVQQGNLLASAFHPEITGDIRVHQYFLGIVEQALDANNGNK